MCIIKLYTLIIIAHLLITAYYWLFPYSYMTSQNSILSARVNIEKCTELHHRAFPENTSCSESERSLYSLSINSWMPNSTTYRVHCLPCSKEKLSHPIPPFILFPSATLESISSSATFHNVKTLVKKHFLFAFSQIIELIEEKKKSQG